MFTLNQDFIRDNIADSKVIFKRGVGLYQHGAFMVATADPQKGSFTYRVDGSYGDYSIQVQLLEQKIKTFCDCPYPGDGCKHTVAALMDIRNILSDFKQQRKIEEQEREMEADELLSPDEIREIALEDRRKRAKSEVFDLTLGDMFKGEHLVETENGRQYTVTLHDPDQGRGHCTCPDYLTNRLGTCKHILYLIGRIQKQHGYKKKLATERFPFVDVYWDSIHDRPRLFHELSPANAADTLGSMAPLFDEEGLYCRAALADLMPGLAALDGNKRVRIQASVYQRIDAEMSRDQLQKFSAEGLPPLDKIKTELYPYQQEGVAFGLYRSAALIGDEMGLGKTLQAIALGILKKEIFDFNKVLVVTLASLKEQWKREISRFSDEKALVIQGNPIQRRAGYFNDDSLFKITNYEAVLRDVTILRNYKPDLIILDEAQRIKNFSTKTADAVKRIPRHHALVLTGTPLENKLEDVYSIVQFLDPKLLSPLWQFAADHFMMSRRKKGKILGYRNLASLHERLSSIVIRRRKEEVLKDLPNEIVNNYYLPLSDEQASIHAGYIANLMPLLNKKYLTPVDQRRIMELLIKARMVCDSTYLIDRETHISPKLTELKGIIEELVTANDRKVVIFSEWTTMTFLIGRHLSEAGIPFVELTGKVPVKKRQALIDEFSHNPDCKVFLSTDAGGTGLNLQAADCVINFEMPWNPARLNQRIGRVNRIGQKSKAINVINLITKDSIEEKILAGIQLKADLFTGVFDGGIDTVEFTREKRTEMLNRLREMMGDQPVPVIGEPAPQEEIPEDAPAFLNPKALAAAEEMEAEKAEELDNEAIKGQPGAPGYGSATVAAAERSVEQPPEKMEEILNSGMAFIGGLMEMATGSKMEGTAEDGRMVHLDSKTGEVTLKFKLPGF